VAGRLHHIGVGRAHARTRVLILIHDLNVGIINAATGELLRELVLDPIAPQRACRRGLLGQVNHRRAGRVLLHRGDARLDPFGRGPR